MPRWPPSRSVVLIGALFQGRSAVGLEVSVLLVTSLHRYRELFVLEMVEPRLGALSPSVSASRALGPQACTALLHDIVLKIISVRCRLMKSCNQFPTSAASAATWEAAGSTSVRAFGLLRHGDCLTANEHTVFPCGLVCRT